MKMKLKQKLGRLLGRSGLYLKRSSPTILCCISAFGVVGTAVAAVRATPKAMRLLEKAESEKGEDLSYAEIVMIAAPAYIPSAAIGISTIFCIFGANCLNRQQQARLMSAYALLNNYHKEYRSKLIELHGKEADVEVRNAIMRQRCDVHPLDCDIPDGKAIFYDEFSGESITLYEREVIDAEYHFNRNYVLRGHAFLNEFYDFLGLPETEYGAIAGWSMNSGIIWVDFEHRLVDYDTAGISCYSIDMIFPPEVIEE